MNDFGGYGQTRVNIIDSAFNALLQNLIPKQLSKALYGFESCVPKNYKEVEKFRKLGKYEKYSTYPDEKQRTWMEHGSFGFFSQELWDNYELNIRPQLVKFKETMIKGIKYLVQGRNIIHQNLVDFDNYEKFCQNFTYDMDQVCKGVEFLFEDNGKNSTIITNDASFDLWGISEAQTCVESTIHLNDIVAWEKIYEPFADSTNIYQKLHQTYTVKLLQI